MLLLVLNCFLYSKNSIAQIHVDKSMEWLSFIPDGWLIKAHPYSFTFNDNFYATFNGVPLHHYYDNVYVLTALENGTIKFFRVKDAGDTVLVGERLLRFKNPIFSISFMGKESGSMIERAKLANKTFKAEILNNDISLSIPIESLDLQYYTAKGHLEKITLNGSKIEEDLANQIKKSQSNILIVTLRIIFGNETMNLPPAIYYLK